MSVDTILHSVESLHAAAEIERQKADLFRRKAAQMVKPATRMRMTALAELSDWVARGYEQCAQQYDRIADADSAGRLE